MRIRGFFDANPGSMSLAIRTSLATLSRHALSAAINVGSSSTCCSSEAIPASTLDKSCRSAVIARTSSGASFTEAQNSQSFLILSPSCMARETTTMPLAAPDKPSIMDWEFESVFSMLTWMLTCSSAQGVFAVD